MMESIDHPASVRDGEELPARPLALFLRNQLDLPDAPLAVEQFPSGYSNLTYLLRLWRD